MARLPHVTLNLDKPRKFRFDMLALWKFQQATGIKLSEFSKIIPTEEDAEKGNLGLFDSDISLLIKLIWAGLYEESDLETWEDVAQLLDLTQLSKLGIEAMQFASSSMGEEEKNESRAESKKNKKNGRGNPPSKQRQESN